MIYLQLVLIFLSTIATLCVYRLARSYSKLYIESPQFSDKAKMFNLLALYYDMMTIIFSLIDLVTFVLMIKEAS